MTNKMDTSVARLGLISQLCSLEPVMLLYVLVFRSVLSTKNPVGLLKHKFDREIQQSSTLNRF